MKRKYQIQISQPTAGGRRSASSGTGHQSRRNGSALILAVVLTTLLATVGVLFVLLSRIDKMAASAASQNRELNLAVDTVVAKISQKLVLDVPGVDPNVNVDYYDYPGPQDRWLASLEPYKYDINDYRWQQISDVTGFLVRNGFQVNNVNVNPPGTRKVIQEYPEIELANGALSDQLADADGDGIADSKWVQLNDITSSKGKPIYAAIRIIDNGAMLNANTAYKFNPNETDPNLIDGSSQMQINMAGLARSSDNVDEIHIARCGSGSSFWIDFQNNVIWRIQSPAIGYLPFDISDELELRYRYCINWIGHTRLENIWFDTIGSPDDFQTVPYDGYRDLAQPPKKWRRLDDWCPRVTCDSNAANLDTRHLLTTCNMDRIIRPDGDRMLNINTASAQALHSVLKGIIDPSLAAQLAVNIVDLRDNYASVTILPKGPGTYYYGFEAQPFISEIAFRISGSNPVNPANNHFALELYNPFEVTIPLSDFRLELRPHSGGGAANPINLAGYIIAAKSWFVITNGSAASTDFGITGLMSSIPPRGKEDDPNLVLAKYKYDSVLKTYVLEKTYDIYLLRKIWLPPSNPDIYLDRELITGGLEFKDVNDNKQKFYPRPDNNWNIVHQGELSLASGTLGKANGGELWHNYNIPTFRRFVTVGDIARVLTVGPSPDPNDMIGVRLSADPEPPENTIRIDLANPAFQQIFNYLTVIDPNSHGLLSEEKRVKGRININTAPWYVIAQLPWVSQRKGGYYNTALAQAIVAYRDKTSISGGPIYNGRLGEPGFRSIGELMNVSIIPPSGDLNYSIRYYGLDGIDQMGFPDLTTDPRTGVDGASDDFEERDVIFARISNLVTVRSDVFTAYILVRIGPNGPQRRVIATLDRSQVISPTDKVKIIAIQPVPDSR